MWCAGDPRAASKSHGRIDPDRPRPDDAGPERAIDVARQSRDAEQRLRRRDPSATRQIIGIGAERIAPEIEPGAQVGHRSEEHTSELQSLMRISYAVFCLKKKQTPKNN